MVLSFKLAMNSVVSISDEPRMRNGLVLHYTDSNAYSSIQQRHRNNFNQSRTLGHQENDDI